MKYAVIFIITLVLFFICGVSAEYDEGCKCELPSSEGTIQDKTSLTEPYYTKSGFTIDPVIKAVYDPETGSWFDIDTGDAYSRPKDSTFSDEEMMKRWEELLLDPEIVLIVPPSEGKESPFITKSGLTVNPSKRTVFDPQLGLWFSLKNGEVISTTTETTYAKDEILNRWTELKKDTEIIRFIPLIS